MPRRNLPPAFLPGPLSYSAAEWLNQLARDVYDSLLGRFTATSPMIVRDAADGINYSLDLSALADSILPPPPPGGTSGTLVVGDNIAPPFVTTDLEFDATGSAGGGVRVVSQASNRTLVQLVDATTTLRGLVNTILQSFAGDKTFVNKAFVLDALGIGFTGAANLTHDILGLGYVVLDVRGDAFLGGQFTYFGIGPGTTAGVNFSRPSMQGFTQLLGGPNPGAQGNRCLIIFSIASSLNGAPADGFRLDSYLGTFDITGTPTGAFVNGTARAPMYSVNGTPGVTGTCPAGAPFDTKGGIVTGYGVAPAPPGPGVRTAGNLTANGTTQVGAAPIITNAVQITPTALNTAVILPTLTTPEYVHVTNASATIIGLVFPPSGQQIGGGGLNNPATLNTSASKLFHFDGVGWWAVTLGV